MSNPRVIPGVHIQWPWSQLILSGKKTVETRSYPLPKKYLGKALAVIETPGPRGAKAGVEKSRIIGIVCFSESFQYRTKEEWVRDRKRHLVEQNDPQFAFSHIKQKWGWVVSKVELIENPVAPPKRRGIVFATACRI